MRRWNDLDEVPAGIERSVVSIGNFDGVHRGHRAVLGEAVTRARAASAVAVAVTFDPHPLRVLRPDRAPEPLTGLEYRLALLAATGLDAVLVLPFTRELAGWAPERFVREVLVDRLGALAVVVGRDMRFGHRNSGDVTTLRALEEGITDFGGCVMVISHDRWFLDRIATHILAFEGDSRVTWFEGNYQDYHENRRRLLGDAADRPTRIRFRPIRH